MPERRPTILVADDDPATTALLADVLGADGYRVLIAQDAPSAIQLAQDHAPDLMLLDILMPGGGGYEVLRALRERAPDHAPPIIFLTGLNQPEQIQQAFALGALDHLTKPFGNALLRARVHTWLIRLGALPAAEGPTTGSPSATRPDSAPH